MKFPIFIPTIFMILITITHALSSTPQPDQWSWIPALREMDGQTFKDHITPIIQMSANAYRYPATIPIQGWEPLPLVPPMAPPTGGCHALAYTQSPTNKVVISFRGTQLNNDIDGQADLCADMVLWMGYDFKSLPQQCKQFAEDTLDYFTQAVNFTQKVVAAYPVSKHPLLITGHSLGAGLAILTSAAMWRDIGYVVPVVGFGAVGTKEALKKRGLHLEAAQHGDVVIIGNKWDEVMRTSAKEEIGTLCLYPAPEPSSCVSCFESQVHDGELVNDIPDEFFDASFPFITKDCRSCFAETHLLETLIELVMKGIRPKCYGEMPCLGLDGYRACNVELRGVC